ncbi:MAG TPA: bifunctional folylpolyglutamate synthase/dihydrofolate synthase, partial [Lachnospiraceae bacterium]|nr:bifunctional folylpolyglutamate synthase/dihydrofolate synthase [Lachnospiraceae bacterium]
MAMDQLVEEGYPHVSFFEGIFVIATLIFERHKEITYVIYETGLGGRLDATNVLQPVITVITSIGKDHMQYLGNTILEIAGEKAGIIKENTPVVYLGDQESSSIILERAVEKNAKAIVLSKEMIKILKKNQKAIDFSMKNRYIRYDSLTIDTCAEYQVENAGLAILALFE